MRIPNASRAPRWLSLLAAATIATLPGVARAQDKGGPAENPSGAPITTVDKYQFVEAEAPPPVRGTSNYEWDKDNPVVKFPINVWIGWAPIIAANGGLAPSKDSIFYKKYGFQVELAVIDNPITARDAFAAGKSHILWGTLDMMALFAEGLSKDTRTAPRIFQQIDWSNGGDGIVARNGIKSINDLKPASGKKRKIALAYQSPSHYYLLQLLYYAGIDPGDVDFKFTGDAFQAAAAFAQNKDIDACVTWSPDIYNLSDPKKFKDTQLISSTKDAKRVIADVWAARADFATDHPDVIEGLVRGIFDGMDMLKKDPKPVARMVEKAFSLKEGDAEGMFGDAHQTNCAENVEFFLNRNNAANFEATWKAIAQIYGKAGFLNVNSLPAFSKVMDSKYIDLVQPDYKHQKNEYTETFAPVTAEVMQGKTKQVLTRVVRIQFAPNIAEVDNKYDPNADKIIEEVGRMAAQFGSSTIVVIGHADRSKYEEASKLGPAYLAKHAQKVKELSLARSQGVIAALLQRYPDFGKQKDKFVADGMGWDKPLANDALSRRVEIRVIPPEE
jgi:NitT/TauT family transport system substrate-binding protein